MAGYNQVGHQHLTVGATAVGLTMPTRGDNGGEINPPRAVIYVGDAPVRWRADGTAPTSTVGIFVGAGGYIEWDIPDQDYRSFLKRVQFVRDVSAVSDAALDVAYLQ